MNPLLRNVVIGAVGFLLSAALAAFALLRDDPGVQVIAMLASAILATVTAAYLFWQAWRWSIRKYRSGETGRSIAIAVAGGFMALIAAGSLAGTVIFVLLFAGTLG